MGRVLSQTFSPNIDHMIKLEISSLAEGENFIFCLVTNKLVEKFEKTNFEKANI